MGEAADDMLNGFCCQICGEYMEDFKEPGYPRTCEGCKQYERQQEMAEKKKQLVPKVKILIEVDGVQMCEVKLLKAHARSFLQGGDLTFMCGGYDNGLLPKVYISSDSLEWFEKKDGKK